MTPLTSLSQSWQQWLVEIRRDLHKIPELGFHEERTAAYIAQQLDRLAITYTTGDGTGIIATIGERRPGDSCVALRADMDGLPLDERTGLTFASTNSGVMHACGHDGHMAMLLGAASLLQKVMQSGCVKLLFQPAEETEGGAQSLINAGALEDVRCIFGGHIDPHLPTGTIAVQPGLICAYTDGFTISLTGEGGHAARPHECRDSIVAACHLVGAIQTLVSRETNPLQPAVISVGKIHGGTAANVIAEKTILEGTIRSTSRQLREKLKSGICRMTKAVGGLFNLKGTIIFDEGFPPVINDQVATEHARQAAISTVGEENVRALTHPSMGGEDFSFYLQQIPGCFVRFGASRQDSFFAPLHSPQFDFDEQVLEIGARFFAQAALVTLECIEEETA